MRLIQITIISVSLIIVACHSPKTPPVHERVIGQLKIGFDIDDTVLFSRDNFLLAPHISDDPYHLDYGWVNQHDSLHSVIIQPIGDLIRFLRSQGHKVYFITARPGINGAAVGRHLSRELGFSVIMDENLFFSPKRKDPKSGNKYTSKHEVISRLGLHVFYGDSDSDMIAASIAGVRGVRVVRDMRSVEEYSKNYFGDIKSDHSPGAPFSEEEYQQFLSHGVGPYGETIYPIYLPAQKPVDGE